MFSHRALEFSCSRFGSQHQLAVLFRMGHVGQAWEQDYDTSLLHQMIASLRLKASTRVQPAVSLKV